MRGVSVLDRLQIYNARRWDLGDLFPSACEVRIALINSRDAAIIGTGCQPGKFPVAGTEFRATSVAPR